ncbi:hypothetical protein AWB81_03649 [Caballeronia arationis]|uniref:Uncharacterized protein n=2 Tax=Caballeronia arationis TaxID=1777142 RepID=A0A7Z7N4W7_9BURK|nr:hypothetical protein AWB81_03649 [Caballeronia arationis]SOE81613.1 hypothetical protein SAMN05446927_4902 [Caballeronia arationis]
MMDSVLEYVPPRFSRVRRPDSTAGKGRGTQRHSMQRPAFNVHAAAIRPRVGGSEGRVKRAASTEIDRDAPPIHGISLSSQIADDARTQGVPDDWLSVASVTSGIDGGPDARPNVGDAASPQIDAMAGHAQPGRHLAASVRGGHLTEGVTRAPKGHATVATASPLESAVAVPPGNSRNGAPLLHVTPPGDSAPDPWSSAWLEWSKSAQGHAGRGVPMTGRGSDAASASAITTTSLAHDAEFDDWTRVGAAGPNIATMNARGVWCAG